MAIQFDMFDDILDLEEQFYDKGLQQGLADGVQAGRIEGRTLGLEKGCEKFAESARLHGKSIVWANRLSQLRSLPSYSTASLPNPSDLKTLTLPLLPSNPRLVKHVKVLYALAESESLSTENTEDAVSDFDDRLKRAQAKTKIVERMIGEVPGNLDGPKTILENNGNIEDLKVPRLA